MLYQISCILKYPDENAWEERRCNLNIIFISGSKFSLQTGVISVSYQQSVG